MLWNNYYFDDSSWMRWSIDRCKNGTAEEVANGSAERHVNSLSPCASKEEIDDYAHNNIMVLQSR
jgi:hypothetical protein